MAEINEFQKLIEDFSKLKLKDRDEDPTFLDIAKCPHWENVWSNILAFYLAPGNSHHLDALLLKSIFQSINDAIPFTDLQNISVHREYSTQTGKRIDIVVIGDSFVLGIENKVDAELNNDLADYSETIDALAKDKKAYKIVLSKYQQPAKEGFENLLYSDLIKTIKQHIGEYTAFADTKYLIFLFDFLKNIENNITFNMMNDNPELRKFIAENLDKVQAIVEVYNTHLNRPHEIHRLLNSKSGIIGTYWANKEQNIPVLFYKLDNNAPSDSFEIDFHDTRIDAYYTTANPQLKELFDDDYSYTASDEEIAEGVARQMSEIIKVIKSLNDTVK
jgi:hypothetical protein